MSSWWEAESKNQLSLGKENCKKYRNFFQDRLMNFSYLYLEKLTITK